MLNQQRGGRVGPAIGLTVVLMALAALLALPRLDRATAAPGDPPAGVANAASALGTANPFEGITVTRTLDSTVLCTTTADGAGDWVCALGGAEPHGTLLTVDGSTGGTASFTVDAVAPATPVPNPSNGTLFTGTAEPGSTIHITDTPPPFPFPLPPSEICTTLVTGGGTYSCSPVVPGPYSFVETYTVDAALNQGGSTAVFIDSSPPGPPTASSDGTEVVGVAEPESIVEVRPNSALDPVICTTGAAPFTGDYTCALSPTVGLGTHLFVTARDVAGNTSPATDIVVASSTVALTITASMPAQILTTASPSVALSVTRADLVAGTVIGPFSVTVDSVPVSTLSLTAGSPPVIEALPTLPAGPHTVGVSFAGDVNFAAATASTAYGVVHGTLTTSTPVSVVEGSTFTLSADVAVTDASPAVPTGSVDFSLGVTALGTATLSAGTGTSGPLTLPAGTHVVAATYSGDTTFDTSATTVVVTVTAAPVPTTTSTTTTTTTTPPATTAPPPATTPPPPATTAAPGPATTVAPFVPFAPVSTTAAPRSTSRPTAGTTPPPVATTTTTPRASTTTSTTTPSTTTIPPTTTTADDRRATTITFVSPEPRAYPNTSAIDITVAVTADGSTPTGDVVIESDNEPICETTLASGHATCSVTFDDGAPVLEARYVGDADHAPSSVELDGLQIAEPAETIVVQFDISTSASVTNAEVRAQGAHLASESLVIATVASDPVEVARFSTNSDGTFDETFQLPDALEDGEHHVIITATAADGTAVVVEQGFSVENNLIEEIEPSVPTGPLAFTEEAVPLPVGIESFPIFDPADHADTVLHMQVATFTLIAALTTAAASSTMLASRNNPRVATASASSPTSEASPETIGAVGGAAASAYARLAEPGPGAAPGLAGPTGATGPPGMPPPGTAAASAAAPTSAGPAGATMHATGEASAASASAATSAPTARTAASVSAASASWDEHVANEAGDRSRSWRWPLTPWVDARSRTLPHRVGPASPLVARIAADATYLRAMVGSLSLLVPVLGIVVGVAAGVSTDGSYLPPTLAWVVALAVIGATDSLAGASGSIAYLATTLVLGGMPNADGARSTAGLLALWFAPVLIAASVRPLRRTPTRTWEGRWDRLTDGVLAPLFGMWGAQGIVWAQNGLSGHELPITDDVAVIGLAVYGTILARVALESVASNRYPQRIAVTDSGPVADPGRTQLLVSLGLRVALFMVVIVAFFPMVWQVWASLGIFIFGALAAWSWISDRLPNSPTVYRYLPTGLLNTVIMILLGQVAAFMLAKWQTDAERQVVDGLVYLALPGLLVGALAMIGREGDRPQLQWWHRIAAIPLVGVLLHFNLGWF